MERKIRLNWRLIHFPLPMIDYVVAHELAHLREMNHSARFWAVVASVYPDYDGAKAALRRRSQEMPVLFAELSAVTEQTSAGVNNQKVETDQVATASLYSCTATV